MFATFYQGIGSALNYWIGPFVGSDWNYSQNEFRSLGIESKVEVGLTVRKSFKHWFTVLSKYIIRITRLHVTNKTETKPTHQTLDILFETRQIFLSLLTSRLFRHKELHFETLRLLFNIY